MVDEPLEVEFHLQGAVPVLESEHGAPVQPEGGVEHLVVEHILDGLVVQVLVGGHEQLDDLHAGLLAQVEPAVGVGVLAAVFGGAAEGIVGVVLVQPVEFIQHRGPRLFQGRDAAEQVPQTFKVVLHLPAAPHDVAAGGIVDAVAGAARHVHGFQNVDVGAGHLAVPHQEAGRRQGSQTAAYQIGVLVLHPGGLFRPGKGFIVAVGVVDALAVLLVHAQFGVAVIGRRLRDVFGRGLVLFGCQSHRRPGAGQTGRRCREFYKVACHDIRPPFVWKTGPRDAVWLISVWLYPTRKTVLLQLTKRA